MMRAPLVLLVLLTCTLPQLAAAQVGVRDAEERYARAMEYYEATLSHRENALQQHEILLDRQQDAGGAADEDGSRTLRASIYFQGKEVMQHEVLLRAAADSVADAARVLREALDRRETALLDRLEGGVSDVERNRIASQITEIRARQRDIEERVGDGLLEDAQVLPELGVGPRDGPRELLAKAEVMETWADRYDAVIADVDHEIAVVQRRIQQQRGQQDMMADIGRFDSDVFVGGSGDLPRTEGAAQVADDGAVPPEWDGLTLPERMAWLEDYREMVEGWRDEALGQAQEFHRLAEGNPR